MKGEDRRKKSLKGEGHYADGEWNVQTQENVM